MPTQMLNKDERIPEPEESSAKLNCWEYLCCGREPGGEKVAELCTCPAATFSAIYDGQYNNGKNLGRRCWRIAGTLCADKVQGTFASKIETCRQC